MTRSIGVVLTVAAAAVAGSSTQPAAIKPVGVTASAAESKAAGGFGDFPAEKTIDGDLAAASSWRAEVSDEKAGQWIQYDLGTAQKIAAVRIAFVKGEERSYRFTIETSDDQKTWATAFNGASSGKDRGFESFASDAVARYVRIRGFGNSSEKFAKWVNITEVEIVPATPRQD